MANKKLLIDKGGPINMQLTENKDGKWTVRGQFGRADVPTENKRVYPKKIWSREIEKVKPKLGEMKVFMESDHPADGKTSLKRVSGILVGLEMSDDGEIIGEAILLDNEHGRQLKSILDAGGKIGVSSRGMGSTKSIGEGMEEVQDDFQYMTHDFVADPAVITSYPDFIVENNKKESNLNEVQKKESSMSENKEIVKDQEAKKTEEASFTKDQVDKIIDEAVAPLKAKIDSLEEGKVKEKTIDDVLSSIKEMMMGKPQDDDKKKDEDVQLLKSQLESAQKQIAEMEKQAAEMVESTKKIALGMMYEKAKASFPMPEKFTQLVGESKDITSESQLQEYVRRAKVLVKEIKIQEDKLKYELKRVQEQHDIEKKNLEKKLSEEKNARQKDLVNKKNEISKLYIEEQIKGNPNASKLRTLLEGVTDKSRIDKLISEYAIASNPNSEYNSIRSRLEGLNKDSKVVEKQLNEASGKTEDKKVEEPLSEGVDKEIASLGFGNLEEVKGLAGI